MTQKAQTVIRYTVGTHAAEKMTPSRKALRLCEKIADGHITADHAVEKIKLNYGLRASDARG